MIFERARNDFDAQHFGPCGGCETTIRPGDRVEYRDGFVCHVECTEVSLPSYNRVCSMCWQEVAGNGTCGCDV